MFFAFACTWQYKCVNLEGVVGPSVVEVVTKAGNHLRGSLSLTNALCGYPIVKMEIRDSSQTSTTAPISCCLIISDRNIWRLPAAQFHF